MSIVNNLLFAIRILLILTSALSDNLPNKRRIPLWTEENDLQNPLNYTVLKSSNQVSLHNGHENMCGGTILDKRHVLTAAHCVHGLTEPITGPLYVLTGDNKTVAAVEKFYMPKSYHGGSLLDTDIAVLKLTRDLPIGKDGYSKTAELPRPLFIGVFHTYENSAAQVVGNAAEPYDMDTEPDSKPKDKPMKFPGNMVVGQAKILHPGACDKPWADYMKLPYDNVCAILKAGVAERGNCNHDGGYGITVNGTVIGVESIGNLFCYQTNSENGVPIVYTRVSLWLPFIYAAMADEDMSTNLTASFPLIVTNGVAEIENSWIVLWKTLVMIVAAMFL